MERIARIELDPAQLGRLATPLVLTRIGIPIGTRTPTNSFGDCDATNYTIRETFTLVGLEGNAPSFTD